MFRYSLTMLAISLFFAACSRSPFLAGHETTVLAQVDQQFLRPSTQSDARNRISSRREDTRASDTLLERLRSNINNRAEFGKILEEIAADAEPGSMADYEPATLPSVGDELSDDEKKEIMKLLEQMTREYKVDKRYIYYGYYATFSARLVGKDALPYLQRLTRDYIRAWQSQLRQNVGEEFGLLISQRIALGDVSSAVKDWEQVVDFSDDNLEVRHLRPAWEFFDDPIVQGAVAAKLEDVELVGIADGPTRRLIPFVFSSEEAQPLFKSRAVREYLIRLLSKSEQVGTVRLVEPKDCQRESMEVGRVFQYKVGSFMGRYSVHGSAGPINRDSRKISLADIALQEVVPGFVRKYPMNNQESRREEIRLNAIKRLEQGDVLDLPPNFYSHMAIYRP